MVVLFMTAAMLLPSLHLDVHSVLEELEPVSYSGTADRVVIDSPPSEMTADEVVQFDAVIYDAVNTVLVGEVNWSASNGSISDDGWFYPWSSGLVEIIAESQGVEGSYNISITAGVATSIEITSTQFMAKQSSPLSADLLDSRGNRMAGSDGMVWDLNGMYFGQGTPSFSPESTSSFEPRNSLRFCPQSNMI